jgi:hypothetical protein
MMADRTIAQEALFYGFSLERHVPADHLLRPIAWFMDLSGMREHPRPFYSKTGRPSLSRSISRGANGLTSRALSLRRASE